MHRWPRGANDARSPQQSWRRRRTDVVARWQLLKAACECQGGPPSHRRAADAPRWRLPDELRAPVAAPASARRHAHRSPHRPERMRALGAAGASGRTRAASSTITRPGGGGRRRADGLRHRVRSAARRRRDDDQRGRCPSPRARARSSTSPPTCPTARCARRSGRRCGCGSTTVRDVLEHVGPPSRSARYGAPARARRRCARLHVDRTRSDAEAMALAAARRRAPASRRRSTSASPARRPIVSWPERRLIIEHRRPELSTCCATKMRERPRPGAQRADAVRRIDQRRCVRTTRKHLLALARA